MENQPARASTRLDSYVDRYAARTAGMTASEIRALFSVASRPEVVSLAGGMPYVSALPEDLVVGAMERVMREQGPVALQYGSGQGVPLLREQITEVMSLEGISASADDVIVTTGSQHALELFAKLFLDPGDLVLAEGPSYVTALVIFKSYQAEIDHVPMDEHGLIPEALREHIANARAVGRRIKFLYTIPTFHNPAGVTLTWERRLEILEICRENGILVLGVAALAILFWTRGSVTLLVVLYSVSVFLTFAISLFGLCRYWWQHRKELEHWMRRFVLSLIGFVICASILLVLLVEKFAEGGWAAALIIGGIAGLCIYIRNHYRDTKDAIQAVDQVFANQPFGPHVGPVEPNPDDQTAVFIVGSSRGGGLHALLWVQRMFPGHFKNFIFVNARTVDTHAYGGEGAVEQMRAEASATLKFFVDFCHSHGMASAAYLGFGTDVVDEVTKLCEDIAQEYPNAIFFTSKLIFEHDNWFTRLLHNQAALAIQRRLHFESLQMVILPMKV